MEKFFKLKENNTNVSKEFLAGVTTFFAMAYIIIVNPQILSQTGMPIGAVFMATIIASAVGTLFMGLFANVPYALAPGMGLNAFFTYTVCLTYKFSWQEALAMVFICGVINVVITVTKIRKSIVKSIPESLQNAISGGIGIFIAYIGMLDAKMINFDAGVPALSSFNSNAVILTIIGLFIIFVLLILKVKGAILISIIATTLIGIPMKVTVLTGFGATSGLAKSFSEMGTTFGAAFSKDGILSLFDTMSHNPSKALFVMVIVFAFSLTDTFDTIGTFIGTGKKTGIFDGDNEKTLQESSGFKSKMDKALFADSIATSVGAILGTSNTTTYLESAAGIEEGGRTGLTSVVTAALFLLSIFIAPVIGIIPMAATAPALIAVGIMMAASFKDINWNNLEEAIPCFFAAVFMALSYSISYGIAAGFIFYCLVKIVTKKYNDLNPIIIVSSILFVLNFILLPLLG